MSPQKTTKHRLVSFAQMNCSVAQALAQIGDPWTMLILRDAFNGITRFDDFEGDLGIASNVLSNRLRRLVTAGILTRRRSAADARSIEYRLTPKGFDLYPLLVALAQWGERWSPHPRGARVIFRQRVTGERIAPVQVRASNGDVLSARDVEPAPGPGADARLRALFAGVRRKAQARSAKP